jgi:ribonuclease P protein component
MAVGLRAVGTAVRRNRVRRLIRESFRLHQHELPAVDVCVTARAAVRDATSPAITASLQRLWRQVRG